MTAGADGSLKTWDIRRATKDALQHTMDLDMGPLYRAIASPGFEHVIVGSDKGAVTVLTMDDAIVARYEDKEMTLLADEQG